MTDLWQAALRMQADALAAQRRSLDAGAAMLAPARALVDAQDVMLKAAEANRAAWASWAKLWGIDG